MLCNQLSGELAYLRVIRIVARREELQELLLGDLLHGGDEGAKNAADQPI